LQICVKQKHSSQANWPCGSEAHAAGFSRKLGLLR
jgi:hypothetical protein